MTMLRLLAVLAAGLVLIVTPTALDPDGYGMSGWVALFSLVITALMAGSFLYFAAYASRMRRNAVQRKRGAMLLMIPAIGSLAMLATGKEFDLLLDSGILLGFTILLLANLLAPAALGHTTRQRLRRERTEPSL